MLVYGFLCVKSIDKLPTLGLQL